MILKILLFITFTLVIIAGISLPMVSEPKSWLELPIVPGLEDKARIIFFHVPTAWVTMLAYLISMFYGIKYLSKKNYIDDLKSVSAAGLGLVFCVLATITGSIWAKFTWGSFWNWDPRETSIFILLLIYGAYFALRSSIDVEEKRASISAVYSVIAGITVPFFIFVMPRIVSSLHPDPIVNPQAKIHMNPTMLVIFIVSLASFTAIFFWMYNLKIRLTKLEHKKLISEEL
jgi:heme exporter protein C